MASYRHILLAADLVARDDHPVSGKAAALSRETGALLSIVHVVEQPYYYGLPYDNPSLGVWMQEIEQSVRGQFQSLADQLEIPAERRHFLNGQAKQCILETAEKVNADLIVLGSHARHGIGLLLMGSTATAVLHGAKCDVLAVRVNGTKSP